MMIGSSLHILCFGDSLTAGWSSSGVHSYSIALEASLTKALPDVKITIDNQGLNGDQVNTPPGGFLTRMDILCKLLSSSLLLSSKTVVISISPLTSPISLPLIAPPDEKTHPTNPYTHAVIWGGTNDLNNNFHASPIYQALKKVWAIPISHNTSVLALTITECGFCDKKLDTRRDKLNAAILKKGEKGKGMNL
jgi:hypothetical protein